MKKIAPVFTAILLLCLFLTSCGIKDSSSIIKSDPEIENKYTQAVYSAENMTFSDEDFIFFKTEGFLDAFTPQNDCLLSISPNSSVTLTYEGVTDNGFALSTARMTIPGESDIEDFRSAYKIADCCSLVCTKDASADEKYTPSQESYSYSALRRISIGAYKSGDTWTTFSTDELSAYLGYSTDTDSAPEDSTLLIISAYSDKNDNITRIDAFRGTAALFKELNADSMEFTDFIAQAEKKALAAEQTAESSEETAEASEAGTSAETEAAAEQAV